MNLDKVSVKSLLYYIAFFIAIITQFLDTVNINTRELSRYAALVSIGVLIILFLFKKKYTKQNLIIYAVTFFLVCISIYFSRREIFLLNMYLLIILSDEINFEKLLNKYLILLVSLIIGVVLLNQIGWIEGINNYLREGIVRETLGFKYPTFLPNYFFHLTLVYCFLKKRLSIVAMILLLLINQYLYALTDTKAVYYYILLFVLSVFFAQLFNLNLSAKMSKKLFAWISVISVVVPVILSLMYASKSDFIIRLDYILTSRLNLGHQGIQRFGLNLFGANIEWITLDKPKLLGVPYFYVDSSFLNIWLNYGLFILILLVVGFYLGGSAVFKEDARKNNLIYLLVFFMLMLHSMFDPQFFALVYNPFLLLIGNVFSAQRQMKETSI